LRRLSQIIGGMSRKRRFAALPSHAAGFFADWGRFSRHGAPGVFLCFTRRCEGFYPQISQIGADFY
jgi:hypothetical protein